MLIKSNTFKRIEDPEFIKTITDDKGRILFGVSRDGTVYISETQTNNSNNNIKTLVMGQYYNPVILKENWKEEKKPVLASVKCYDYDNGAKLMEHSYVHNNFVGAVMRAIYLMDKNGTGVPFVWCGDYADEVDTKAYPIKETPYHDEDGNVKVKKEGGIQMYSAASDWIYGEGEHSEESAEYAELKKLIADSGLHNYRYCINHTKKQYVKVPEYKKDQWTIHPLPILTSSGNGAGGGDYAIEVCINPDEKDWNKRKYEPKPNAKWVGAWAYDNISVSNDIKDCKDYEKIDWEEELEY